MTTAEAPPMGLASSIPAHQARPILSGKRIALVGSSPAAMNGLAEIIADAEGFTRYLSPLKVGPNSEILKPFELILLDVEAAAGTAWMEPEGLAFVHDRCIALGPPPVLLQMAAETSLVFREYWTSSDYPEDVLLRCVLALRPPLHPLRRTVPAGSTVVLADDDTSVTAIVRRALERNGMTCEVASSGRTALALIAKVKPCAAVLDVHMPTMDGFEILSHMKSIIELAHTPVILLTACEKEADVIRAFSLGADDYVCKPFNPMELTIRLMRVIGRI